MLHHRQQLDVRVAHLLDVGDEPLGELAVGQVAIVFFRHARPRSEVHFVDRHRPVEPRVRTTARARIQSASLPHVLRSGDDRRVQRRQLEREAERIGLQHHLAVSRQDLELVALARRRRRE